MSWAVGFDERWKRWIGYGVPAYCDFPGCAEEIDRGLAYVCCGEEPYGGDGCGLYFCEAHHPYSLRGHGCACSRCHNYRPPFTPKPDHPKSIHHQETDPSWLEWRKERDAQLQNQKAKSVGSGSGSGSQDKTG